MSESKLSMDQFIDLCILSGCDYRGKVSYIGATMGYNYITKQGSIDGILNLFAEDATLSARYIIGKDFDHLRARSLFKDSETKIITAKDLETSEFNE